MSDEKWQDFNELKTIIGKQKRIVADVIEIKQDNIEQESKTIGELKKCSANYVCLDGMLNDMPEAQVLQMDDNEYYAFTGPARDTIFSGEAMNDIYTESKQSGVHYGQHYSLCASIDHTTRSGTSGYIALSQSKPDFFPNRDQITKSYEFEDSLHSDIDYIKDYLHNNLTDIEGDFASFIDKYNAFKSDSSQYQDLIGSRSMFFFKMIFEYSSKYSGIKQTRAEAIRTFVFGKTKPFPSAEPIIQSCKKLYVELSSQDDPAHSVKIGKADPAYIDQTFRRIIGKIAALLKLRDHNFQP